MNDDRRRIDLDRWLRSKVRVLNDSGVKGFDRGVRTFKCPLCRDEKGRGWSNVQFWSAGCFNVGCVAHERLGGGALELVRRLENLPTRTEAFIWLRDRYGVERVVEYKALPREGGDFCRFPREMRALARSGPGDAVDPMRRTYLLFVQRQWGVTESDAHLWGLGYCLTGRYARRVIIPIVMGGRAVAFQARAVDKTEPKYLTSRHGPQSDPEAECARSAAEMLFNYDRIEQGGEVVLVEGVGDVMGWHRGNLSRQPTASGMLGLSLTPEKLALLEAKRPARVVLAADSEADALRKAAQLMADLRDWDLEAVLGTWRGGKDAGSGAKLEIVDGGWGIADDVRARLTRGL